MNDVNDEGKMHITLVRFLPNIYLRDYAIAALLTYVHEKDMLPSKN